VDSLHTQRIDSVDFIYIVIVYYMKTIHRVLVIFMIFYYAHGQHK
jgi:hypothetical protein